MAGAQSDAFWAKRASVLSSMQSLAYLSLLYASPCFYKTPAYWGTPLLDVLLSLGLEASELVMSCSNAQTMVDPCRQLAQLQLTGLG